MKLLFPALLIFCLALASCNHSPKEEQQKTVLTSDSVKEGSGYLDSLIVQEPIISTSKHYFSDTASMDSFVAEIPAGNIVGGYCFVKVFNHSGNLIFQDSINPSSFYSPDMNVDKKEAIKDLKRAVAAFFSPNNFTVSGQQDAIRNASADQIKNMAAWNEAINDSSRIVFSYDALGTISYISYAQKLKKAVIAVQTYSEVED